MALVQCPDCGKMISDKAKTCPNCGCPSDYFAVSEENSQIQKQEKGSVKVPDQKRVVFRFGGQEFSYLEKDSDCIKAMGYYLTVAELMKYIADVVYDELGEIGAVLRDLPDVMGDFMQEFVFDVMGGFFYQLGDSISVEQFLRKYENRYTMQYEVYYSDIVEEYAKIRQDEAKLAEYRSAVKASRGRWTGGGFGLKGAVKGAVTAGMLNCGADFLHSFGDAADERRDSLEIKKKLKELYKAPQTKQKLSNGIRACVLNIVGAIHDEMVEIGALSAEIEISYNKAVTLYNNTIKWETDKDTLYKNMAQCIRYYPIEVIFYQKLEPAIIGNEEKDISGFIEFWGFYDMVLSLTTGKQNKWVDFNKWETACVLSRFYRQYERFQRSDHLAEEKRKALAYKEARNRDSVHLADNIRRRFGGLVNNIEEEGVVINNFLYMIRPEFRPAILKKCQETDQFLFCDNGEIVVTDYAIRIASEPIGIDGINEIWYGETDDEEGVFFVRVMLKNHKKYIGRRVKKNSTIKIITLLNIALEPYREITYETVFDSEVLDIYITLRNNEDIRKLDNQEDKRKKRLIEEEQKKRKAEEARRYSAENRTDSEVELSTAVRRRFQKLFDIGIMDDDYVINKYIYEMESENLVVSSIARRGECKPDEFMLFADEVCAITDHMVCIIGADKRQSNFSLNSINEIYYSGYKELTITLKGEGKAKNQEKKDRVKIYVDIDKEHKGVIFFFLCIVLEPYRDIDYIPEIQNIYSMYCPDEFLRKFEEKESFSAFIENVLDDESDKAKKSLIEVRAEERRKIRKDAADSYRKGHIRPEIDKFAAAFAVLYPFLYEKCERTSNFGKDIKYFTRYQNHFDYEVYDNLKDDMRKRLDEVPEKGARILGGDGNVLLTDRYVNLKGKVFYLYDIKEILIGLTVQAEEAGDYDDWIDSDSRYIVELGNGSVVVLKLEESLMNWKVWYPLNYALKILHNCHSDNHFMLERGCFCERCNSFQVVQEEGFLGKKYRCTNCSNKSKKSILVFGNDEKTEINELEVSTFISFNKLDMEFEKPQQLQASMILCKKCGKQIMAGTKFCNYCGQPVKENVANNKKKFCVFCGKEIARETKFCNFCGKPNSVNVKDSGVNTNDM